MRRLGYVIGLVMIWVVVIVALIGFFVKNGWPGVAFAAFIATALVLIIFCEEEH